MTSAGVSVAGEMPAQAAQGIRHIDLLEVTQRWHPGRLRQLRWPNGSSKEASTPALIG